MYQLPVLKIKLTNVAVVKLTKAGKRFEIACYRNKVLNYRQGIETDLSEVLQTERVFTNAQKGEFASHTTLQQVFGTTDQAAICQLILQTGHVQISELERAEQSHAMARMIATYLAEHCVSSKDGRSYTVTQITHAMKEVAYAVHPTRSVKQQCMDCLSKLQPVLPIRRAKMELLLTHPVNNGREQLNQYLQEQQLVPTAIKEHSLTVLVDPSLYRPLQELMTSLLGTCEILRQTVKEITPSCNLEGDLTIVADTAMDPLVHILEHVSLHDNKHQNNNNDDDDNNDDDEPFVPTTKRATQKKQLKLSKKAKRRDKEDAVDRQERIMTEQKRRQDREGSTVIATALGGTSDDITTTTTTKSCNTCGGTFTTTAYRAHFKSDWHRYNQKLLLQGMAAVSEQEFILCDADFLTL